MTMDHTERWLMLEDAERLLRDRFGDGQDYLDPVAVMSVVRAQALPLSAARPGGRQVSGQEVLAALTQIEGARADLDTLERDLIRAARGRRVSWQRIADALGLGTRQSAETRALRLERATARAGGRDVAAQRLDQARQRSADTWCAARTSRFREVSERLIETSGAWQQLRDDPWLHLLAATLAAGGEGPDLARRLEGLRMVLVPHSGIPLEPSGPGTVEAASARDAMLVLLGEVAAVRAAVGTARGAR